jgi:hypothetical protein
MHNLRCVTFCVKGTALRVCDAMYLVVTDVSDEEEACFFTSEDLGYSETFMAVS